MILSLQDLKTFSNCPYSYYFNKKDKIIVPPISQRTQIIIKIIKKCYLRYSETQELITWRTIINWVDSIIFKDIDLSNITEYEKGRTLSEYILSPLRIWHQEIYRPEACSGFIDVPLSSICGGAEIVGELPLIKALDPLTITLFSDKSLNQIQIFNNLIYRGLVWLLSKNMKIDKIKLQYLFIGTFTKFDLSELILTKKDNEKTEYIIENIANAIVKKITYPTITSSCNQCHFKLKCSI
jgi:hypothetical protein